MGLFAPPVGCGKCDDAGERRMKNCLVVQFLSHGLLSVELVVWAGPCPKEETEEHWTHVCIQADGQREEGSAGPQKC